MLIFLLIFLLISNATTMRRDISLLFSRVVIKSLLLISFIAYNNLHLAPLSKGIALYGGLLNVTTFTLGFNIFILLVSAVILTLTAFFPRKVSVKAHSSVYSLLFKKLVYNKTAISNKTGEQFRIIEYPLIIVFIVCGALFLISTSDLISIFLSIELQSYGLYILSTLYRDSESSTASGLTYFLLGGLSSCFILLGSALLYANTGTTNLENIYVITSISEIKDVSSLAYLYQPYYFHLSLIIMCVGLLLKVSAAPFHFGSPDVYDGITRIVTTYVVIIANISIFAFLLKLAYYTEENFFDFNLKSIFVLSSLLCLIIGSVLGFIQAYKVIYFLFFALLRLNNIRFAMLRQVSTPLMSTLIPLNEYCAGLGISMTALLIGIEALIEVHNTWSVPRFSEYGVQQDMITVFHRIPMDIRHTYAHHVLNRVDDMVLENPSNWRVDNPMCPSRTRIISEATNRLALGRIIDDSTIQHHVNLSGPWMSEFFRLRFEVHRQTINKEGGFIWEE